MRWVPLAAVLALAAPVRAAPEPSPAPCPGPSAPAAALDATLAVTLAYGRGVGQAEAQRLLEEAASYWRGYGLRLVPAGPPLALDADFLIAGTVHELDARLSAAGIDPKAPLAGEAEARAGRLAAQVALAPLEALLTRLAAPDGGVVVVVVRRIVKPGSLLEGALIDVTGLAFSPASGPEDLGELWSPLLQSGFTPTVLLASHELARANPVAAFTPAHEVGHALGLGHRRDRGALMAPMRETGCWPWLGTDELSVVAQALDEGAFRTRVGEAPAAPVSTRPPASAAGAASIPAGVEPRAARP